jgi:hypothetical protein
MSNLPQLSKGSLASGAGILCVGPPRTGTKSLAKALQILGYTHIHHLSDILEDDAEAAFETWGTAARSNVPWVAQHFGVELNPYDRAKWDSIIGEYQVVTDAAAGMPGVLIPIYPDAKVIMFERDFESWFRSWERTLLPWTFGLWTDFCYHVLDPLLGSRLTYNTRSFMGGYFEATSVAEAREKGPRILKGHYRVVREKTKPENLLVCQMGDGWKPLCEFLGTPVPNVPYPRENQAKDLEKYTVLLRTIKVLSVFKSLALLPWRLVRSK